MNLLPKDKCPADVYEFVIKKFLFTDESVEAILARIATKAYHEGIDPEAELKKYFTLDWFQAKAKLLQLSEEECLSKVLTILNECKEKARKAMEQLLEKRTEIIEKLKRLDLEGLPTHKIEQAYYTLTSK